MSARLLVVGAKPGSLGAAVGVVAAQAGYNVYTAGISGEAIELDLGPATHAARLYEVLAKLQPQHIVCTVGGNVPEPDNYDLSDWWAWHYQVNAIAPMRLLDAWREVMVAGPYTMMGSAHYVAVSSNSAHIPRTRSAAYCASKAALSMALRVRAREVAGEEPYVYGYEPGLLAGTPMTKQSSASFSGPLTRMKPRGLKGGIEPGDLAELIVANLGHTGAALNGSLIRYDADEL